MMTIVVIGDMRFDNDTSGSGSSNEVDCSTKCYGSSSSSWKKANANGFRSCKNQYMRIDCNKGYGKRNRYSRHSSQPGNAVWHGDCGNKLLYIRLTVADGFLSCIPLSWH